MSKPEIATDDVTNVRWEIPDDYIQIIKAHQKTLGVLWQREVTREEAAIDLIRSRKLPKIIITHE